MMATVNIILLFILGLLFVQFSYRFVLTYSITENHVRIRFLGIPLSTIPYGHIRNVKLIPVRSAYLMNPLTTWSYQNRLWFREGVLIVKKYALIRNIVLTPAKPREVVEKIQSMIPYESDARTRSRETGR
jgi:hypothetical protein